MNALCSTSRCRIGLPAQIILCLLLLAPGRCIHAQTVPPLVNYQGRLANPDGSPLPTADYTLTFNVFDAATNGALVWGPQVFDGVAAQGHGAKIPVVQGYFNVMLGPVDVNGVSLTSAFNASNRFVEVTVSNRPPIAPRQQILTTPFAFQAANAAKLAGYDWSAVFGTNDPVNGKISGTRIANGTITSNQIANGTVTAQQLASGAAFSSNQVWLATGNAGTTPGTNFIGTTDNKAFEIKVNNVTAIRIEPTLPVPNIIGGYVGINGNRALSVGGTIGGGGGTNGYDRNQAANFATVGGGLQNHADGAESAVAGGYGNNANNQFTAIGGGSGNVANGTWSAISGGQGNSVLGDYSAIGGGSNNTNTSPFGAIAGGANNSASGPGYAAIGGAD